MTKLRRRLLIGACVLAVLVIGAIAALFVFLKYSVLPLRDGQQLSGGAVTAVITDHFGPIAIGAYLVKLNDGGFALIDSGSDTAATAIRGTLGRLGKTAADVRAIFLTHGHADHAGGTRAFPDAKIYAIAADARSHPRWGGLKDGDVIHVSGTPFEIFAVPGHTPGSAAILVHGVLFVGDAAAAIYNRTFQPNTLMGSDPQRNVRSLHALANRLRARRTDVRHVAFGHQGPLDGLDPLLNWAATVP